MFVMVRIFVNRADSFEAAYCSEHLTKDLSKNPKALSKQNADTKTCCTEAKRDCRVAHVYLSDGTGKLTKANVCLDLKKKMDSPSNDFDAALRPLKECCKRVSKYVGPAYVYEKDITEKCK